jgi:hypothetical protein
MKLIGMFWKSFEHPKILIESDFFIIKLNESVLGSSHVIQICLREGGLGPAFYPVLHYAVFKNFKGVSVYNSSQKPIIKYISDS